MKVLIKLGGTLLDDAAKRAAIAAQLQAAVSKHELVVVHGGGKQVTRYLEERGIPSTFINGLRVSDEAVVNAVTNVIAGGVNKQLVAALTGVGCAAVGLSGVDGPTVFAQPMNDDLKFTGKPTTTSPRLLNLLVESGYLPVVACIAGDAAGNIYNVNADQLAVSCADGWQADKLFFLTDVPGVKDADGTLLPHLDRAGVRDLIGSGVATGGMQAKLEASLWALENGLREVVISSGHTPGICNSLLAGEPCGTRITLQKAVAA